MKAQPKVSAGGYDDPLITKPHSYTPGKPPEGVRFYRGDIPLSEEG